MSKQEKDDLYYDKIYQWGGRNGNYFSEPEQSHYFPIWKKVIEILDEKSIIADFGCGVGQFAQLVLNSGLNYAYGVDFSTTAIEMAKKRTGMQCFYLANLYEESSFRIKNYNTAILLEVLEHMEHDLKILSYLPEGVRVIFSIPNFDDPAHLRTFTQDSIKALYGNILDIMEITTFKITAQAEIYLCDAKKSNVFL